MDYFVDGAYLRAFGAAGGVSFFHEHIDPSKLKRLYLIRGARGALSSQLLCGVRSRLRRNGLRAVRALSPRRPGGAQALLLPGTGIALTDASYPDALEPRFPIAAETTVDTDPLVDRDTLRRLRSAVELADAVLGKEERRLCRYLSAAEKIYADTAEVVSPCVDTEKIRRYAAGFAAREFPRKDGDGTVKHLFLSTPAYRRVDEASFADFPRRIAVEDAHGPAAERVFELLADAATARGLDVFACRSPLLPTAKTDLLLVPAAGTAFFGVSGAAAPFPDAERTIHTARFLDRTALSGHKNRLAFDKKTLRELSRGAVETAERICELQEVVDGFYLTAADLDGLNALAERIADEICKFRFIAER
ncbi:MAG: hypothetical protein IJL26_13610 [Clostridia bacterium]|nr:hypothetical protein [Clostridia bacterium]